ncbi:MAG: PIG-L family deacetylase [Verrucomicrobiota bacterium]
MKLHQATASIFIPDGMSQDDALKRVTHLGIGAHQDDLEFMALHGIVECHGRSNRWFGGVTCSNGAGSSRSGPYAAFSDDEMMAIRREEQNAAALIGEYAVMLQLDHPSSSLKHANDSIISQELLDILLATTPEVVYTHNPADKHDTHVAVCIAALQALREMPRDRRPHQVIGCEVWRDLDWMPDEAKVIMDVSGRENFAAAITRVFDSQISGGKRYDLATIGRRAANATFSDPHRIDSSTQVILGMDLTPMIRDDSQDIAGFVGDLIDRFHADVRGKIHQRLGII